jgi:glycyl-tRNA synthetase beta chain
VAAHTPTIRAAAQDGDYKRAFSTVASMGPVVAKFFDDVMVMAEDEGLRAARLQLVATLRDVILGIADLSEMAAEA